MKKVMIAVLAALAFGTVVAENIEQYDKVYVNAPAKVRIVKGDTCSIDVMAADTITEKSVKYDVKDGVLKISGNETNENILIVLSTPEEPTITTGRNFEILK